MSTQFAKSREVKSALAVHACAQDAERRYACVGCSARMTSSTADSRRCTSAWCSSSGIVVTMNLTATTNTSVTYPLFSCEKVRFGWTVKNWTTWDATPSKRHYLPALLLTGLMTIRSGQEFILPYPRGVLRLPRDGADIGASNTNVFLFSPPAASSFKLKEESIFFGMMSSPTEKGCCARTLRPELPDVNLFLPFRDSSSRSPNEGAPLPFESCLKN